MAAEEANKPVALITGANRGIGLEYAKQLVDEGYKVIATCRNPDGATDLKKLDVTVEQCRMGEDSDFAALAEKYPSIDLLILNAGITGPHTVKLGSLGTRENFLNVFHVNAVANYFLVDALKESVMQSEMKQIMVISSEMSSITEHNFGAMIGLAAYRMSKCAVNMVVKDIALQLGNAESPSEGVHIISMAPGWVKTDMGGEAPADAKTFTGSSLRTTEDTIKDLINIQKKQREFTNGGFYWFDGRKCEY